MLENFFEKIISNKEWLFSGIVGTIIATIVAIIFGGKRIRQKQKIGNNSSGYQAAGNITINDKRDENDD